MWFVYAYLPSSPRENLQLPQNPVYIALVMIADFDEACSFDLGLFFFFLFRSLGVVMVSIV